MKYPGPYNETVRTLYENPCHAGDLKGTYTEMLCAEASESASGAHLVLCAGIAKGKIAEMRFRVWGCPHLIAAAEKLCSDRENGAVSGLAAIDTNSLMDQLSVPVEKTGKMFLLEDALESLWAQHVSAG